MGGWGGAFTCMSSVCVCVNNGVCVFLIYFF